MHIAIICSRLDMPGGIERAIANTANLFVSRNHITTLVILDDTKKNFYPIHPKIQLIQKNLNFGITQKGNVISRKIRMASDVLKLRKLLRTLAPDFIIASEYHFAVATILTGIKRISRIVSWEHHHYYELHQSFFWKRLIQFTYSRLDAVVCLNEDEKKLFASINPNPIVIPNFIGISPSSYQTNNLILTVGRLTFVKGIDLLLKTAKLVLQKNPSWKWKLIGDGEMREYVINFIKEEKLQGKLFLHLPESHDIIHEYQDVSLYVMTSRNECLPMTLLEAQSVGLPCISFDCDTGPRNIITNNVDGLLTEKENPEMLAQAICFLIENETLRRKMSDKALQNIKRFSSENIYALWSQLLLR